MVAAAAPSRSISTRRRLWAVGDRRVLVAAPRRGGIAPLGCASAREVVSGRRALAAGVLAAALGIDAVRATVAVQLGAAADVLAVAAADGPGLTPAGLL